MVTDGRYLTVEVFKQWARDEIDVDDALISQALLAAEQAIDNECHRRFQTAQASTVRSYPGTGSDLLFVDDFTTITQIDENSVTLTAGDDYQLEPVNQLSAAGESIPYDCVRRLGKSWYRDGLKAVIDVTGTPGWLAIPPQVVEACKIVTKDVLTNRNVHHGVVAVTDVAGIAARENRTVQTMIKHYRSHRSWGIA